MAATTRHAGPGDLTPAVLEVMEDARVRAADGADRRETITEALAALTFMAAALAMAVLLPHDGVPAWTAAWLVGMFCVLHQIEFDVGEGRTRPVQLVLVPMLIMLPAAVVPLLVAAALLLVRFVRVAARRDAPGSILPSVADGWFSVAPGLVVATLGVPDDWRLAVCVFALAVAAQIAVDFASATVRLRFGLGLGMRDQLVGFAWVYLLDVLLTPVAALAGKDGSENPIFVAAVLPLAALLAVFARERRGRIENALELHRLVAESEQRLQSIVQNSSDLIAIVAPDGTIRTLTGAIEGIFGVDWRAALGTPLADRVHPDDAPLLAAFLERVAEQESGGAQTLEWRVRCADDSFRHVETVATNLLRDERMEGIVLTARDIEDRKAFEEQLRHRAFHDPLTQLANRALFYDRIEHALSRRGGGEHRVALLFLDLDDFKVINDELGHAVGDELLIGVARRLRGCLRSSDTAARLGGDEFGVLLEGVSGTNEPVQLAERVMAAFAEPFMLHGEPMEISVSVGVTVSRPGDPNVDELLRRADLAMYAAKRHGKRRWQLYDGDLERSASTGNVDEEPERATWFQRGTEQREEIQSLLRRPDAVSAVFQPVLDLRTGLVAGYEALARFATPEVRPPNAWFAQAHRCGLGYELEARALAAALAATGRPAGAYLTLNVSPSSLSSVAVQNVLPERLDGLVIEITENELLTDDPAFQAAIRDVRERGGLIAVDDAGAGYAGLKHVMRLAPDLIKLDRSLVAGVHHDPARAALISSFVRFARDSQATVCAEGIETLDDLVALTHLDVTYGQGYVIARPAPDWPRASAETADACVTSFTLSLAGDDEAATADLREHALERIVNRVSAAQTEAELAATFPAVADELRADEVTLVHGEARAAACPRRLVQVLASDPNADPSEVAALTALGWRSMLRVPLVWQDHVIGLLEAYSRTDRPWSRFEIRRARVLSHQFGAALRSMERAGQATTMPGHAAIHARRAA